MHVQLYMLSVDLPLGIEFPMQLHIRAGYSVFSVLKNSNTDSLWSNAIEYSLNGF